MKVLTLGLLGCSLLSGEVHTPRPNVVVILVDDMGWSDIGPYGGEIQTPALDQLAANGIRFTRAYNTSKCYPSRTCLLSGVYAQQAGIVDAPGTMRNIVTIGEVARSAGYRTLAVGKHHGLDNLYDLGFDRYWGIRDGAGNHFNPGLQRDGEPEPAKKTQVPIRYWADDETVFSAEDPDFQHYFPPGFYSTDAFTAKAVEFLEQYGSDPRPFLLYLAYTAPHDPIQAWPEDIAKYDGVYDAGYEAIRSARYQRQIASGLIDTDRYPLSPATHEDWAGLSNGIREDQIRRMQVYAAMIDRIDQGIAQVVAKLEELGQFDDTLVLFCSDNGSSAEVHEFGEGEVGAIDRWTYIGESWSNVANTPFRLYKNNSYEGGINTPLIATWINGIEQAGRVEDGPVHFIDFMPTLMELTGAAYPLRNQRNEPVHPLAGQSFAPAFRGEPLDADRQLHWEFRDGEAILSNGYKAVRNEKSWQLFDTTSNRTETEDLYPSEITIGNQLIGKNTIWKLLAPKPVPDASRDAYKVPASGTTLLDVLSNDSGNVRASSLVVDTPPSTGSVSVDPANHTIRYLPDAESAGLDWFSYRITGTEGIQSPPIPVYLWIGDKNDAAASLGNARLHIVSSDDFRFLVPSLPAVPGTVVATQSLTNPHWQPVSGRGTQNGDSVWFVDSLDPNQPIFLRFLLEEEAFIQAD